MTLLSSPARVASDGFHRKPVASAMAMAFLLVACANPAASGAASIPADTESTMNPDISFVPPQLTAEQALSRVLELIRGSQSIADFTPERLEQVMRVPVSARDDGYGFYEPITEEWSYVFFVEETRYGLPLGARRQFQFVFTANERGGYPPMTAICKFDFERFSVGLEAMGFSRGSVYGSVPPSVPGGPRLSHGRRMYDLFSRSGLIVEVYPSGESSESREKIMHDCIERILVY